ncbi:cation transport protein-domain-containing protein [Pseudomassariella vexata]|uniref:Potassium transport protein n=1 Tax=Pseudomassariella vexata TaxID=1141098 RepID=A0A1Y2DF65_9PEZI|nr:cation transport protein-domain-containing protein [Pseudomassariella vexata]ORY57908.1 cation transport protein-domain-containing protein [Pseudomassariella vexata]
MGRRVEFLEDHPRLERVVRAVRPYIPPLNFITLHYAYFISVTLLTSVVFWGSSNPKYSISYTDSLFLVISAMTEAGLNTVNLSQMTTFQQFILWFLIIIGSSVWVSIWTVAARKHVFESRFQDIVRRSQVKETPPAPMDRRRTLAVDLPLMQKIRSMGASKTLPLTDEMASNDEPRDGPENGPGAYRDLDTSSGYASAQGLRGNDHIAFASDVEAAPRFKASSTGFNQGSGAVRRHVPTVDGADDVDPDLGKLRRHLNDHNFLTSQKVGRNAQFHDLTSEERELLGGTEYRALKVLFYIVPAYSILWQVLGCVALGAWIANNQPEPARENGMSPWWNGIFNGVSAFNNSGMNVLDANMIPYGSSYFVLITMGAMILAGNTALPVFLRLWLWAILKALNLLTYEDVCEDTKHTLAYILKYPRRVYTNLFPSRTTWWLVFMLVLLNGIDWVGFEILNLGNPSLAHIPVGSRIIDGLFQAIAVRSGGFYVVSIPTLYIGLQVLYVIMMYISVYPVVITMRHSNVYEERSLGIYDEDPQIAAQSWAGSTGLSTVLGSASTTAVAKAPINVFQRALRRTLSEWHGVGAARHHSTTDGEAESRIGFISHQIRGQLTHDLWWLVVAVFIIVTIETHHFLEDPVNWSVFNIVFEVVSAYGCVGISVGVPTNSYSFSGGWYKGSKLILCLVMLRGRHRGLPVALDRAVRLPGDDLIRDDEDDHRIRTSMSMRRLSDDGRM